MNIEWDTVIWYFSQIISNNLIYKSFRLYGLTNKLDGSENNLFKKFDLLQQKVILDKNKEINGKAVEDIFDEKELLIENE